MLTLTRKQDQSIVVETTQGPVQIYVKEIRRNQVRLGVIAPSDVRVDREEVYLARIKEAAKRAGRRVLEAVR